MKKFAGILLAICLIAGLCGGVVSAASAEEKETMLTMTRLQFNAMSPEVLQTELANLLAEADDDFAGYSDESVAEVLAAAKALKDLQAKSAPVEELKEAGAVLSVALFFLEPAESPSNPVNPKPGNPKPADPKPSNPGKPTPSKPGATPVPPTGSSMNHTAAGIVILLGAACVLSVFRKKNEE